MSCALKNPENGFISFAIAKRQQSSWVKTGGFIEQGAAEFFWRGEWEVVEI